MSIRPKQMARLGQFYLQEAVLDVLYENYLDNPCLGPAEISKQAGIYRDRGAYNIMNDAIVQGILNTLSEQDKVERCTQTCGQGGWKLTQKEYDLRKDDV